MEGTIRCDANYVALSPISFLERSAVVYSDRLSVVYGDHLKFTWRQTRDRCVKLASSLVSRFHIARHDVGGRMIASLRGKSIEQLKDILIEGATVFMKQFIVASNGTIHGHKYLSTAHKYKIVFFPTTVVGPIQDFTGSRHCFKFTSFTEIATNDLIKEYCVC